MPEDKPSLIEAILAGCARVDDGRTPADIMLRAIDKLGALAAEMRLDAGALAQDDPAGDGVPGRAMDLLICVVDHLRAHDAEIGDRELVAAITKHPLNQDKPFTAIALGWGMRDGTPMRHQHSRVLECMSDLNSLNCGPEEDHYREREWRREVGSEAIRRCLQMIAAERPGITDDELIEMAGSRLDAWAALTAPADTGPEL